MSDELISFLASLTSLQLEMLWSCCDKREDGINEDIFKCLIEVKKKAEEK